MSKKLVFGNNPLADMPDGVAFVKGKGFFNTNRDGQMIPGNQIGGNPENPWTREITDRTNDDGTFEDSPDDTNQNRWGVEPLVPADALDTDDVSTQIENQLYRTFAGTGIFDTIDNATRTLYYYIIGNGQPVRYAVPFDISEGGTVQSINFAIARRVASTDARAKTVLDGRIHGSGKSRGSGENAQLMQNRRYDNDIEPLMPTECNGAENHYERERNLNREINIIDPLLPCFDC